MVEISKRCNKAWKNWSKLWQKYSLQHWENLAVRFESKQNDVTLNFFYPTGKDALSKINVPTPTAAEHESLPGSKEMRTQGCFVITILFFLMAFTS